MRGVSKKWDQDDLPFSTDTHTVSVKHFVMTGATNIIVGQLSKSPKCCTTLRSFGL